MKTNCFLWSILTSIYPCKISHTTRVPKYRHCFNELNNDGFNFSNGYKLSDIKRIEKMNNYYENVFELNFYRIGIERKHKLLPFEIFTNDSDRVIDP